MKVELVLFEVVVIFYFRTYAQAALLATSCFERTFAGLVEVQMKALGILMVQVHHQPTDNRFDGFDYFFSFVPIFYYLRQIFVGSLKILTLLVAVLL